MKVTQTAANVIDNNTTTLNSLSEFRWNGGWWMSHHAGIFEQGGICRGGSQGTSPSLDLTFPLTGLSENFPARERMIPRHC